MRRFNGALPALKLKHAKVKAAKVLETLSGFTDRDFFTWIPCGFGWAAPVICEETPADESWKHVVRSKTEYEF